MKPQRAEVMIGESLNEIALIKEMLWVASTPFCVRDDVGDYYLL